MLQTLDLIVWQVFPVNATCLNTVGSGKPEKFQCSPMTDLKPRANVTSIAGQFAYKGQDLCCQSVSDDCIVYAL